VGNHKSNITLTKEGYFDVSTDKNIAVFIVDTLDSDFVAGMLDAYPETRIILQDFKFFKNALGMYPTTKGALPQILTGSIYKNEETYYEYIEKAWETSPLTRELKQNNFSFGVYTLEDFISAEGNLINIDNKPPRVESHLKLYKEYSRLVLFRYAPHFLKKYFVVDFDSFNNLKPLQVDTVEVFNLLCKNGINTIPQNTLRIYHFMGAHEPYELDENLNFVPKGTTVLQQTRGSFKIIEEYITQLKNKSCYDNSMIIILGDHGGLPPYRENPAVLIKYPDVSATFTISEAPISYLDLMPTLISGITNDYKVYGKTFLDVEKEDFKKRKRNYLYYDWDDSWDKEYLPEMREYVLVGKEAKISEENFSGNVYNPKQTEHTYKPAEYQWEELFSFIDVEDRKAIQGISKVEDDFAWSLNDETTIQLRINSKPENNVLISVDVPFIFGEEQNVSVYLNGTYIDKQQLTSIDLDFSMVLPKKYFRKGVNEIKFEYSNANSPIALGINNDTRKIAIGLRSLELSCTKTDAVILDVDTNKEVNFQISGNSSLLHLKNWDEQEQKGRWTKKESSINFMYEKLDNIRMTVHFIKLDDNLETEIILNGHLVTTLTNQGDNKCEILLPKEFLNDTGYQEISFSTKEAKSPQEMGVSEDSRILGIFVTKIDFNLE
jgi:hypothetical protein